jgi:hypothetical protein
MREISKHRKIVGFVGIGVATLAGIAWFNQTSYVVRLALWSIMWLGGFHAYFAFHNGLTQRLVRTLDYYYLVTGGLAILVLAASYTEQRRMYSALWTENAFNRVIGSERRSFDTAIAEYAKISCRESQVVQPDCRIALELATLPESGMPFDEMRRRIELLRSELPKESDRSNELEDAAYRSFETVLVWIRFSKASTDSDRWQPSAKQELDESAIFFGWWYTLMWPMVLAAAIALRITKVTIEVLEWTKERTPPSTISSDVDPSAATSPPPSS